MSSGLVGRGCMVFLPDDSPATAAGIFKGGVVVVEAKHVNVGRESPSSFIQCMFY